MMRRGFTLTEILVSLGIFSVVSTAMIGIMATSVDLYRTGEYTRAANEEAMAVFGLLEKDLARAVSPATGGRFFAQVIDAAGNCSIGWTIKNPELNTDRNTKFVFWFTEGGNLRRKVSDHIGQSGATTASGGAEITAGCLHFGVWLVGSTHKTSDGVKKSVTPVPSVHWSQVRVSGGYDFWTEPFANANATGPAYDTRDYHSDSKKTPLGYPHTVRFTVMLTGNSNYAPTATLIDDVGGQNSDLQDDGVWWRITGGDNVLAIPGNVARIGDELIGFHKRTGNRLFLNDVPDDGPLNQYNQTGDNGTNGRAVMRSKITAHSRGDQIQFGRLYSITKTLSQ